MLSEIRYWHDDDESVPEGESPDVWQYRQSIREKCILPHHPPHSLTPEIAEGIKFVRHQISVRVPDEFSRDDAFSFFLTHENPLGRYYKIGAYGDIEFDLDKADAAMRSSRYMPGYWDVEKEDIIASHRRSLNLENTLCPGFVEFPTQEKVQVKLGIRRHKKPDSVTAVEGLFYQQFIANEWHWEYATPQLFAAIEKNLEHCTTNDPFEWVKERALIASAYSVLGGGKECSPVFLAEVYEGMASTMCNTPPVGHEDVVEYEVGVAEQNLLLEIYGRYADSVSPEMVSVLLEHAHVLTPDYIRESTAIRDFLEHLPEMLENGLNVHRISEFTRAPSKYSGTLLERLECAIRLTRRIYCGQKPWWFKEDFDLSAWFMEDGEGKTEHTHGRLNICNDPAGRRVLEEIANTAGFAFSHVLGSYQSVGYRLAAIEPFTEHDAMEFTSFVVQNYGIGNEVRSIEVLRHCLYVLEQEELSRRQERLKELREHLEEVRPQTVTFGALESSNPVFEMPGVNFLAATMLGKQIAENGEVHEQRIGLEKLQAINELFMQPLALRARKYAPALPSYMVNMERRGLLVNQSPESQLALPVPDGHLVSDTMSNPALGILDFYVQLKEECGEIDRETAKLYFRFCAARMPDPWHPPKGFLKFLQIFEQIETPGWRFSALEHPKDRPRVQEENQRREIGKQMLVSNMLDAWIMDLLTVEELESLFAWLAVELTPEQKIEIEKDVMYNWQGRLRDLDNPPRPQVNIEDESEDDDIELRMYRLRRRRRKTEPEEIPPTQDQLREEAEERIRSDVQSAIQHQTKHIRSQRMVGLQETFSMLSVINSLSIARLFDREELRSVLVDVILPGPIRGKTDSDGKEQRIRSGVMLSNLSRLQELGGIDNDALRGAVEDAQSPDEARNTAQRFIEEVVIRCMNESIASSIPNAIHRVTEIMAGNLFVKSGSKEKDLEQEVRLIRGDLERELTLIWEDAPFAAEDIVERLLREFRIPQYVELFEPIQRFNNITLPKHLPLPLSNPRFSDLQDSNTHTARTFYFVGSRVIQERARLNGEALDSMAQKHGDTSHVDMSGGTALMRSFTNGMEDVDPTDLHAMFRGLADRLPDFQKQVDRWRLADVPLGPVGGRWHFSNPVSDKHMELFTHLLSLSQTPFRMIHSNTSLIIPGFMSKNEMRLFSFMLALEGLVDPRKPQLQLGVTGRLMPELCAYFGSSCILGTADCPRFKLDSFVPHMEENHILTAARIVSYDAYPESQGQRRNSELPFMFAGEPQSGVNVQGRTDILERWNVRWNVNSEPDIVTMDDIDITHAVGSTLRHVQFGGPLKEVGLAYMERHRKILSDYGLSDTLNAPWVYEREHEAYEDSSKNPEHFNRCVKACSDAHLTHAGSFADGRGVVFEARENIDTLIRQVQSIGTEVLKDPRYESDVRALLQATTYESLLS